jgi:2-oxo-3-hexenedioate decarboxylase
VPRGDLHRDRLATTRTALYLSARVAAELDAARVARRAIVPPSELARLSIDEAYDVQDAFVARREAFGDIRSGWKLGLTSDVKQRIMGIDRPVFGRTFAAGRVSSGASASLAEFIAPRTEPEIAFGLARALDPRSSLEDLRKAVAWVAPALEITDSRYTPGTRTAVELIADNTSSAGYVLGARISIDRAPNLATLQAVILRNGVAFATASSAGVLGNPVAALGLLARHLEERGLRTAPGDIVLSGAITDAFSVAAGDRVEARLAGLGTAAVDFV